jgi:hypothetical protein
MNKLSRTLSFFAVALWWGSLTTIGFFVVPMLFMHMDTSLAAGRMAAALFAVQTYISLACGLVLLGLYARRPQAVFGQTGRAVIGLLVLGIALPLIVQFVVTPHIVARDNLKLWHALGSGLYLLQWFCVSCLLYLRSH